MPTPTTLADLETLLQAAGERTRALLTRDELEAEWRTRRQPVRPQAAPVGLFEQRQESLFPA